MQHVLSLILSRLLTIGHRVGLVGSLYYTTHLSDAEKDKIKFYFNYDMIASPQPRFVVYADNDAHEYGAIPIYEYLKAAGAKPEYAYVALPPKGTPLTATNIMYIFAVNLAPRRIMWASSMLEYPAAAFSQALGRLMTHATTCCVTTSKTSIGMRTKRMPRLLLMLRLALLSTLKACQHGTRRAQTPGLSAASRTVSETGQLASR